MRLIYSYYISDTINAMRNIVYTPSVIALIVANIIPIIGVLFWGYDLGSILILYWAESGIIGIYTLLKMLVTAFFKGLKGLSVIFLGPFFTVHFGGFMGVHLAFILALISSDFALGTIENSLQDTFYKNIEIVKWALLALLLSHGFSFIQNFILKREFKKVTIEELMGAPYVRIFVMHFTIILGAFAAAILGNQIGLLFILIFVKILIDAGSHTREHKKFNK